MLPKEPAGGAPARPHRRVKASATFPPVPNLVGIFDPSISEDARSRILNRMMVAVDYPEFEFVRCRHFAADLAVGNVLPNMERNTAQPAVDSARGLSVMIDGEILNGPELKDELRLAGVPEAPDDDAELALSCWRAFGPNFYEELNGCFNLVCHDRAEARTTVITDRIGSRLLMSAHDGKRFVFSNELKGVVAGRAVPTRPGGQGFFDLYRSGGHHGRDTWLEGITLIPPGTVVQLDAQGVRSRRYARLHFNEGRRVLSETDHAEAFAAVLRRATERCMKDIERFPIAITLSGGLDSRAVALSVDRRHRPLTAITYGDEESADVRYARMLADVLGLDHLYIEPEAERLTAENARVYETLTRERFAGFFSGQIDRIVWRTEGLTTFDSLCSVIWHPIYKPLMRFMLNGAGGDAMTGSHLTPDLLVARSRADVIHSLRRRFYVLDAPLVQQVLAPGFYARHAPESDASFARDVDEIQADAPLAIANIWDMENRQRRGSFTSFSVERYFCTCRSPFLDHELVDLLCQVPGAWRFQQRLYKRMLVDHYPEAAHVPWAYTRGRITKWPAYEFAREVVNFARSRVQAWAFRDHAPRWEFKDHLTMLRKEAPLHAYLRAFTRRDDFPSHLLDAKGVRAFQEDFAREGGRARNVLFSHLLGHAKALELFLSPERIRVPPVANPSFFGVPTH